MKLSKDIKLQPNFTFNEFLYVNDKELPDIEKSINIEHLAIKLQRLRDIVGPIDINSGFRGVVWNNDPKVKGSKNSYHLQGLAADIKFDFSCWTRSALTNVLKSIGFTNVNFYWNSARTSFVWVHVDIGNTWDGKEFFYRDLDSITQLEIEV